MVRVRIPGNAMSSAQMRALAGIASDLGGGYGDITTRGNIQIREIAPKHIIEVLARLSDCALDVAAAPVPTTYAHHLITPVGHRSGGVDRYPSAGAVAAALPDQQSRPVRASTQVQHQFRRRRPCRPCHRHQ